MPEQTRLNVNINSFTAAELKTYAARRSVSITESVRWLVGIGAVVAKAMAEGKTVVFRDEDGNTERLVIG